MNRKGVCKESYWPYEIQKFRTRPPSWCYDAAQGNNLCKYERLNQDIDQLKACLRVDNCPFVFGFKVYDSIFAIKQDGKMSGYVGGHAVVAVGYNDYTKCITVLNSWGEGWGDRGYFYMPYDFITDSNMCFDFWKITFACEKGKPRPKDSISTASGGGHVSYSSGCSSYGASGYGSSSGGYGGYYDRYR